jgi:hypothetical protein
MTKFTGGEVKVYSASSERSQTRLLNGSHDVLADELRRIGEALDGRQWSTYSRTPSGVDEYMKGSAALYCAWRDAVSKDELCVIVSALVEADGEPGGAKSRTSTTRPLSLTAQWSSLASWRPRVSLGGSSSSWQLSARRSRTTRS